MILKRKNQKRENSKSENISLKYRHKSKIYSQLKQFKKIQLRYETKIKAYETFLKIAILFIGHRLLLKETCLCFFYYLNLKY